MPDSPTPPVEPTIDDAMPWNAVSDEEPEPERHCWEDSDTHDGTCMLANEHDGPHEFTPDSQITVAITPPVEPLTDGIEVIARGVNDMNPRTWLDIVRPMMKAAPTAAHIDALCDYISRLTEERDRATHYNAELIGKVERVTLERDDYKAVLRVGQWFREQHERFHHEHWAANREGGQRCDACTFCAALAEYDKDPEKR